MFLAKVCEWYDLVFRLGVLQLYCDSFGVARIEVDATVEDLGSVEPILLFCKVFNFGYWLGLISPYSFELRFGGFGLVVEPYL